MNDLIIIGAGPASFTAAIYSTRREMKTLIISKDIGGQIIWAHEIENYLGFKNINNFELINLFKEHTISSGAKIIENEVVSINKENDYFKINTINNEEFQSKTVILSLGLVPKRLNIEGENLFNGKGISYCANCDGPFYKNKTIAVIGGGNSAFDAAEVMSKIASEVYLLNRTNKYKAFNSLVNKVKNTRNIKIINNAKSTKIKGSNKVEELYYIDTILNEEKMIKIDGIFVEIGRIANTGFIKNLVELDDYGQIKVDKNQMTKTNGLFAAGDVVSGEFKQISIASGQGTIAALAAYQYLQKK